MALVALSISLDGSSAARTADLVVPRCDATELFEPAVGALHEDSMFVLVCSPLTLLQTI